MWYNIKKEIGTPQKCLSRIQEQTRLVREQRYYIILLCFFQVGVVPTFFDGRKDFVLDIDDAIYLEKLIAESLKDSDSFLYEYHSQISTWLTEYKNFNNRKKTEYHGMSKTRLYRIWNGMRRRCYNSESDHFMNYGGRGIIICEDWKNSFISFKDWAYNNGYNDEMTIDRIDVNGNYEPNNCRWISASEQHYNKRTTRKVMYHGQEYNIEQLSQILGLNKATIRARIKKGEDDDNLEKVALKGNNKYLTIDGITKTYKEWEDVYGLRKGTISSRIRQGWNEIEAATTPIRHKYKDKAILLTYKNETHTLAEWAEIKGVSKSCMRYRYSKGWDVEKILSD